MRWIVVALLGLASVSSAWAKPLTLMPLESQVLTARSEAVVPDGLAIEWRQVDEQLVVVLANNSAEMLSVDWNRSAFVKLDGSSIGVVPGSARRGSVDKEIAPSTIPPHARLQETLVRRDVDLTAEELPPLTAGTGVASVTLAITLGETTHLITERFDVTARLVWEWDKDEVRTNHPGQPTESGPSWLSYRDEETHFIWRYEFSGEQLDKIQWMYNGPKIAIAEEVFRTGLEEHGEPDQESKSRGEVEAVWELDTARIELKRSKHLVSVTYTPPEE